MKRLKRFLSGADTMERSNEAEQELLEEELDYDSWLESHEEYKNKRRKIKWK